MATKLFKPITRELIARGNIGGRDIGTVIVTIEAPDMITFRMKGKRLRYTTSLHNCMTLAFVNFLMSNYRERVDLYESKRKAGYKVKRPNKPNVGIFSPVILKALKLN